MVACGGCFCVAVGPVGLMIVSEVGIGPVSLFGGCGLYDVSSSD
jgi:hypothetical protein